MFERFGEFDSYEEINTKAAELLTAADTDAVRELAAENGLDPGDAEDYITGAERIFCTALMAAMERGIRALKKEREALRAMDLDTKDIDYKIRRRTEAYKDFCKDAKVKEKTERLRYECSKDNLRRSKAWREMENAEQSIEKSIDSGIMKDNKGTLKMKLQFFAEEDIYRQESGSLKRAIRKYEKRVREHEDYLREPKKHCADWDEKSIEEQDGLRRHWNKEIRNFKRAIKDREDELKKRGDYDDD